MMPSGLVLSLESAESPRGFESRMLHMDKDKIYREVHDEVYAEMSKLKGTIGEFNIGGGCLYFAGYLIRRLHKEGIQAMLQAGTMSWPRLLPEEDDGVINTHFGYVWEPHTLRTVTRMAQGLLPEMHSWVATRHDMNIIDMSTKYLPGQCWTLNQMVWTAPNPPDYLWANASEIPAGVMYAPDEKAIMFAYKCLLDLEILDVETIMKTTRLS
jgi:hypothetical protein